LPGCDLFVGREERLLGAIATPLAASTSSIAPNLPPAPTVSVPSASCELYHT
jgi:hypothetical protein